LKKKTLNFFKKLKTKFPEDQKALDSITYLMSQIENWQEEDNVSKNEEFPLPKEIATELHFALFSDGACRGNPGPGSWGSVGQDFNGEIIFKASGVETSSTNNRMEMMGAIDAFETLMRERDDHRELTVCIYSDSKYVVDGMKSWIHGWKKRGWKKADKKAPENVDLWKKLDTVVENFLDVQYFWVKGHAGHPQNELCDQLANEALDDSGF
jgi:ribonuclease HI